MLRSVGIQSGASMESVLKKKKKAMMSLYQTLTSPQPAKTADKIFAAF